MQKSMPPIAADAGKEASKLTQIPGAVAVAVATFEPVARESEEVQTVGIRLSVAKFPCWRGSWRSPSGRRPPELQDNASRASPRNVLSFDIKSKLES